LWREHKVNGYVCACAIKPHAFTDWTDPMNQRIAHSSRLDLVGLDVSADGGMLYAVGRDNELVCQAMDNTPQADSGANKHKPTRKQKKVRKQEDGAAGALTAQAPKLKADPPAPVVAKPAKNPGEGLLGLLYWVSRLARDTYNGRQRHA
jgi:hypothetical protein